MAEPESEDDMCRIVTDVAVQKAVEKCGSEEAVKDVIADMFGFAADEETPECPQVLQGGITDQDIATAEAERRYAMCRAWQLVRDDGEQFRSAVNQAWSEIREAEAERE